MKFVGELISARTRRRAESINETRSASASLFFFSLSLFKERISILPNLPGHPSFPFDGNPTCRIESIVSSSFRRGLSVSSVNQSASIRVVALLTRPLSPDAAMRASVCPSALVLPRPETTLLSYRTAVPAPGERNFTVETDTDSPRGIPRQSFPCVAGVMVRTKNNK